MINRKGLIFYSLLTVLALIWLGTAVVFAEEALPGPAGDEQQRAADSATVQETVLTEEEVAAEMENSGPSVEITPRIAYNAVEKWRLGLEMTLSQLLGADELRMYGDYSFSAKKVNSGLEYRYLQGWNQYFGSLMSDTHSLGLYDNTSYYQHERSAMIGASHFYLRDSASYLADLRLKLIERTPYLPQGPDLGFEQGTDLYIQPTLIGMYQGYQGKLKLDYSIPTGISDYSYYRVNALIQKGFSLTANDRLIVGCEAGLLRGDYPNQAWFTLGSGPDNIFPNFLSKILNVGHPGEVKGEPFVYLQGYEDNAFRGSNMFVGRVEYQHQLPGQFPFASYPVARVFTTFGNAFDGSWTEGVQDTKVSLGVGLNLESVLENPANGQHVYMGVNLAKGFGDKSAYTFGFDLGMTLDLLPTLFGQ